MTVKSTLHLPIVGSMLIACGRVTGAADENPGGEWDVVGTGGSGVGGRPGLSPWKLAWKPETVRKLLLCWAGVYG